MKTITIHGYSEYCWLILRVVSQKIDMRQTYLFNTSMNREVGEFLSDSTFGLTKKLYVCVVMKLSYA